jgi:uncharacterized protein DUF4157
MTIERERNPIPDRVIPVQRLSPDKSGQEKDGLPAGDAALVDHVACRAGDDSCATAHAATLNRATSSRPSRAEHSLLQLQRQYGNRYVERVLALARQAPSDKGTSPSAQVESAIEQERGGGQNLDSSVRRQMEGPLGADLSGVRVHTDTQADSLNSSLSARAFTTGQDIFFSQGAYQPGSSTGRELIAHELTHVVQQGGDQVRRAMTVSQPGDPHEVEAEETARAIMQSEASSVSKEGAEQESVSASCSRLQRQPKEEEDEKKKHSNVMTADRSLFPGRMKA